MKKVLISLTAILLLSACALDQAGQAGQAGPAGPTGSTGSADQLDQIIDWNGLKLSAVAKCNNVPIPPPDDCANKDPIEVLINVDTNGAPVSVAPIIESCSGKQVTWRYAVDVANPPQFFIVFNPDQFPGNSTYNPISRPWRDQGVIKNQKVSINTREKRPPNGPSECMNYLIVVPDKGILDPVFIIKR